MSDPQPTEKFAVWRTITIGEHGSPEAYQSALNEMPRQRGTFYLSMGEDAESMIAASAFMSDPQEVHLANVTLKDLGLDETVTVKQLMEAALQQGLKPCPIDVGPALRLQFDDQRDGESLWVMSDPVSIPGDTQEEEHRLLFYMHRYYCVRKLESRNGNDDAPCSIYTNYVFMLEM